MNRNEQRRTSAPSGGGASKAVEMALGAGKRAPVGGVRCLRRNGLDIVANDDLQEDSEGALTVGTHRQASAGRQRTLGDTEATADTSKVVCRWLPASLAFLSCLFFSVCLVGHVSLSLFM